MTKEELKSLIDNHKLWLSNKQQGKRANLYDANLRDANLSGADLSDANLYGTNLSIADLHGINLRGADLRNADLSDANLCGTNLSDADLCNADLCNADLSGADLCGTKLSGANLRGADLPDKILQVGPIGSRSDYTVYNVTQDIVQCGCWRGFRGGSLDDFEMRVNEVYPNGSRHGDEYRRLITWFKAERDACQKEKAAPAATGSAQLENIFQLQYTTKTKL